ncbi:MAG: FAD-binding domain-containing protein, partial [Hyphomicrobiales bacterium]
RQGERFDPDGAYVRHFVPEIANLPDKFIHCPWEAPAEVLKAAQIELGTTYPAPLVDHFTTRNRALAALKTISKSAKARETA